MSFIPRCLTFFLLAFLPAAAAFSMVEVRFVESAPKDRFVVVNEGSCELTDLLLEVDLRATNGQLIFDTTGSGAGVEVFQPFELHEGNLKLVSAALVNDGDTSLTVQIPSIPAQGQVSFTIDVDDTLTDSELGQIRVSGAEMQGGLVTITKVGADSLKARFDGKNKALFQDLTC